MFAVTNGLSDVCGGLANVHGGTRDVGVALETLEIKQENIVKDEASSLRDLRGCLNCSQGKDQQVDKLLCSILNEYQGIMNRGTVNFINYSSCQKDLTESNTALKACNKKKCAFGLDPV